MKLKMLYPDMEGDIVLPEPLKHHSPGECRVCGEELPCVEYRLCDACRRRLREMELTKWLGEDGPEAVFLGMTSPKLSIGISITKQGILHGDYPLMQPVESDILMAWQWNPDTKAMEVVDDPVEDVCWLFWVDRDDGKTKSKVFWGTGEALEYMSDLQDQGHTVTKAGIKIFPIRRVQ